MIFLLLCSGLSNAATSTDEIWTREMLDSTLTKEQKLSLLKQEIAQLKSDISIFDSKQYAYAKLAQVVYGRVPPQIIFVKEKGDYFGYF